jgi:hypothetical protein
VPILDRIQKQRTEPGTGIQRKIKEQQLRVVDQLEPPPEEPATVVEEEKKRRYFQGKSIDYTIDELLHKKTDAAEIFEKGWGGKQGKIPIGFVVLFVCFLLGTAAVVYRFMDKEQQMIGEQVPVDPNAHEDSVALALIKSIESTMRGYLAAKTIEEKLAFVRHPEAMKARMEAFYRTTPLTPQPCQMVTKLRPLSLGGRPFWQVLAVVDASRGEAILLEQISDTEVLVDWESHVNYQPMPWKDYAETPSAQAMTFRVIVEESPRYVGEFMDERRWASFRLSNPETEKTIYGYVLRDSDLYHQIQTALANSSRRMILCLQGSTEMKARDSVVIQKMISEDTYRIEPPTSLTD